MDDTLLEIFGDLDEALYAECENHRDPSQIMDLSQIMAATLDPAQ
jgi:hypothetical protein